MYDILFQDVLFHFLGTNQVGTEQWLQYDFGEDRLLTEVKTRGRPHGNQHITSYQIQTWQQNQWQTISDVNNEPIVRLWK